MMESEKRQQEMCNWFRWVVASRLKKVSNNKFWIKNPRER